MTKLNRESKLRERRAEKQARKAARKLEAAGEADGNSAIVSERPPEAREGDET